MKINGIWSKVDEQKMKFNIVLAKKWVGKCPPCPPSSAAPDLIVFVLHTYISKKLNFALVIKFLAVAYEIEFKGLRCLFFSKKSSP